MQETKELLEDLGENLEDSEVFHSGGGIWLLRIPLEGSAFALVGEGFELGGDFALGVYEDEEDEGTIVKEWGADGISPAESADIVRATLATYVGSER